MEEFQSPFIGKIPFLFNLLSDFDYHIIPVFVKDNEPTISQVAFIDRTVDIAHHMFEGEVISEPKIRVSYSLNGSITSTKGKPAKHEEQQSELLFMDSQIVQAGQIVCLGSHPNLFTDDFNTSELKYRKLGMRD